MKPHKSSEEKKKQFKADKMNLLGRAYTHFMLLICLLHQMHGSRLPLEIIQLDTGTQLTDQEYINGEYQIVQDPYDMLAGKDGDHDDKTIDISIKDALDIHRKPSDASKKEVAEPRIFYQTGVSFLDVSLYFDNISIDILDILYIFLIFSFLSGCVCVNHRF